VNIFEVLNSVDVSEHIEKKNNLSYVSWVWAWSELKKRYPDANYTIYENRDGLFYHTDGKTAWVKTGITVGELEHIEYLPVMDYRTKSIPIDNLTSTDVNKAIQRSLTKAIARHGLGLYIYAGEDLPEDKNAEAKEPVEVADAKLRAEASELINTKYKTKEQMEKIAEHYGVESITKMTTEHCKDLLEQEKQKNVKGTK